MSAVRDEPQGFLDRPPEGSLYRMYMGDQGSVGDVLGLLTAHSNFNLMMYFEVGKLSVTW